MSQQIDILSHLPHAVQGNRAAQRQLYLLTKEHVKRVALRYLSQVTDAQDVVQSAYLKAFTNLEQYDASRGDFQAWLHRITVNECLSFIKKRKLIHDHLNVVDQEMTVDNAGLWAKFDLESLLPLIQRLSYGEKKIIQLHMIDQLTYTEIAQRLAIKESSVRGTVTRAKKSIYTKWVSINKSII